MVGGGLMQLVAYGAQEVYLNNNFSGSNNKHNKWTQFFYDKVKTKSTHKIKDPGIQFTKSKSNSNTGQQCIMDHLLNKLLKQKHNLNMYQRANKNFGGNTIKKFNHLIQKKHYTNEVLSKYICSLYKFNFSNKSQMINLIRPVINNIRKQLYLKSSLSYFIGSRINNYSAFKFDLNMGNFTTHIKKMDQLLVTHQILLNNVDVEDRIGKSEIMKNNICPITMEPIICEYVECDTCKTCYDYSNRYVESWFNEKHRCPVCKQNFTIHIKHVAGENIIYNELKKYTKNT